MVKDKAYYDALSHEIIGCAYRVGKILGSGFLEKVYEKALAIEIASAGFQIETQVPMTVYYQGHIVGEYSADMLVENDIILELKAVKTLDPVHFAQCQNYLKATGRKLGLVINFGSEKVKIRRVVNGI